MGIFRGIAQAVVEKAKHEVKDYLIKFMEEEKEKQNNFEKNENVETEIVKNEVAVEKETDKKEIFPLIEPEFIKFSYKAKPLEITIPSELGEVIRMLPLKEFACYLKLLIFVQEQKKNFGYLGNTLKKRIGIDNLKNEDFDQLIQNLESYGVLKTDQVSDNQKTFILYIPFNEEIMTKAETLKTEKPKKNKTDKKEKTELPVKNVEQKDDLPGKNMAGMEDEDLYKSYRTFVSLEIDKAKMRVGRSNFDKIYMEAVKYIDKKYGFKILSDSEKFKEYLTNYYISAFDIKTFDEWKKTKN